MSILREQYSELLALTQLYLLQEHKPSERILANSQDYLYFREFALKQKKATSSAITPVNAPPPERSYSSPPPPPSIVNRPEEHKPKIETLPSAPVILEKPLPKKAPLPQTSTESEKKSPPKESKIFTLAPKGSVKEVDISDLQKLAKEKLPGLNFVDSIPDDSEAQHLSCLWTLQAMPSQIVILAFDDIPKHMSFLNNIGKALEAYGYSTRVLKASKIEQEDGWNTLLQCDKLNLILAHEIGISSLPLLAKHLKESSKHAKHTLAEKPVLLLSDLSFYLKEPSLKHSLWKAIKQSLSSLSPQP